MPVHSFMHVLAAISPKSIPLIIQQYQNPYRLFSLQYLYHLLFTNLRGWLYTILKNSFINNYRRDAKRNTFLGSTENTYFLDLPSHRTENEAELKFIRRDLDNAVESLPVELKVTFKLNAEGFKYHEIAEELQIPIGTVKTRIFVARRILRNKLKDYGIAFGFQVA